jgi:hypothetical protein
MNDWVTIFRDAVPGIAGVTVYDKTRQDILGRYCVAKIMKVPNADPGLAAEGISSGPARQTQKNFTQRPAALRYARKFLQERAAKFGREYVTGGGAQTFGFKPIFDQGSTESPAS